MKSYTVKISTPVCSFTETAVVKTIVRALSGDVGIMAGHIPFVSALKDGCVRVVLEDGNEKRYNVTGAVVKVGREETVILAQSVTADDAAVNK